MLVREYRAVFVHVPKTAGQSVEAFLLTSLGESRETRSRFLLRQNPDPQMGPPRLAHLFAREYVGFGHMSQQEFDSSFKFAFVRNPWSRIVSTYFYGRYSRKFSFREFVTRNLPAPGMTDAYRHIAPQHLYLCDGEGRTIVDYVGRFENLQEDFQKICDRLGLPQGPLPKVNIGANESFKRLRNLLRGTLGLRHRHYSLYFDDYTKDFVSDLYSGDIERFGYSFEDLRL